MEDLVNEFATIRQDVATGTLDRAAPGKFVATVVQVLQNLDVGKYDHTPKVDEYLRTVESTAKVFPTDLRVVVPRVARAMYTLRNKRSIAHKNDADPNIYDLGLLFAQAQRILSELIRHIIKSDVHTANQMVQFVQRPISLIVEDFGNMRLVLQNLTAEKEALLLFHRYYPETVPSDQLHIDMQRRARTTVSNAIARLYKKKLI